jgi:hypothetical protein
VTFSSTETGEETGKQVEQAVALQHFFPQVGRLVVPARRVGRVARAAVRPRLKGRKLVAGPRQARGHVRLFGIDREVHQRALGEFEDRLARIAVVPVLANGIGDGLAR